MHRRVKRPLLQAELFVGLAISARADAGGNGPPGFFTFPILTHVAQRGLVHNHFVVGGDATIPASLAPDRGTARCLRECSTGFL